MAKSKSKKKTFPRPVKTREDDAETDEEPDDLLLTLSVDPTMDLSSTRIILTGLSLVGIGMLGFYYIPGLMVADVDVAADDDEPSKNGDRWINAFYCSAISLTTVGFGDICPANPDFLGRVFLTILPLFGLGFFCGPVLSIASSWTSQVPGGAVALGTLTIAVAVSALTALEDMSISDAIHLTVITGTTIGYGDVTVKTDEGRLFLAIYAILICGMFGAVLDVSKTLLEALCQTPAPKKRRAVNKKKRD
ncbi:ion channel [Nitzschia inconspicua]|uniref:Ion channel n=1 Tax=Nitzschia inconspicua TaxID=303405 RepID=A0A9K3PNG0_9STRA|nr:ion channel [Nitzschia inconspicua]